MVIAAAFRWATSTAVPVAMRPILFFAAFILALAVFVPRFLPSREGAAVTVATAEPEPANTRTISLSRGQNGHFETDALIDGRRIAFLVDTGASVIALREGDAARLGIHPTQREYTMKVSTANGVIMAAPIELNRVEIGDLTVRNVAGLVLPDQALAQNLLGMSFLSRVHWQYQSGKLVLDQ
jgi:aspartyl protease family protein